MLSRTLYSPGLLSTTSIGMLIALILLIIALSLFYYTFIQTIEPFISDKKAIVIIEPREHKNLEAVINNFDKNMPPDWDLYVFYGKSGRNYAVNASAKVKDRTKYLLPLDTDNLTADEYNELLKKATFWNRIDAETILVFQTDAVLCDKSDFDIDEFIKYDYIGCSANNISIGYDTTWKNENFYGIGGLSLRKKSFMLKCIADNPTINKNFPEDVFYSNCVSKSDNRPESAEVLSKFCSQYEYRNNSFGVHKPSQMGREDFEKFLQYCPDTISAL